MKTHDHTLHCGRCLEPMCTVSIYLIYYYVQGLTLYSFDQSGSGHDRDNKCTGGSGCAKSRAQVVSAITRSLNGDDIHSAVNFESRSKLLYTAAVRDNGGRHRHRSCIRTSVGCSWCMSDSVGGSRCRGRRPWMAVCSRTWS